MSINIIFQCNFYWLHNIPFHLHAMIYLIDLPLIEIWDCFQYFTYNITEYILQNILQKIINMSAFYFSPILHRNMSITKVDPKKDRKLRPESIGFFKIAQGLPL